MEEKKQFDCTIEGRYTKGRTKEILHLKYDGFDEETQALLEEEPEDVIGYIGRYTFWAQQMAGQHEETQYTIMHQLMMSYALHASLALMAPEAIDAWKQSVLEEAKAVQP